MTDHNTLTNPFRVSTLTPRDSTGAEVGGAATYELTRQSAHPTRVVGRDRLGKPIEETINAHYSQRWVHPSGTINNVMMRTGVIMSMHPDAVAYETETTVELLREGWLPLRSCPFTTVYREITGTPCLVGNPDRVEDCGGKPDGCSHVLEIAAERQRLFKENHDREEKEQARMTKGQASELLQRMSAALEVAESVASSPDDDDGPPRPVARRSRST